MKEFHSCFAKNPSQSRIDLRVIFDKCWPRCCHSVKLCSTGILYSILYRNICTVKHTQLQRWKGSGFFIRNGGIPQHKDQRQWENKTSKVGAKQVPQHRREKRNTSRNARAFKHRKTNGFPSSNGGRRKGYSHAKHVGDWITLHFGGLPIWEPQRQKRKGQRQVMRAGKA